MEGIEHGHGQKMRGLLYLMTVEFLAVVVGAVQCGLELVVCICIWAQGAKNALL